MGTMGRKMETTIRGLGLRSSILVGRLKVWVECRDTGSKLEKAHPALPECFSMRVKT